MSDKDTNNNLKTESEGVRFLRDSIATLPSKLAENNSRIFPIDAFPKQLQEIGQACVSYLDFHPDYIFSSFLAAASTAIGNTRVLRIKNGWAEPAMIWLFLVGKAGASKTHPQSFAMRPISERDNVHYRKYSLDFKEYEKQQSQPKAKEMEDQIQKPICTKHIVKDYTPEALIEIHKNNTRGLVIYADELAGWFKNFNRYNKGSEIETWLSIFSAQPITVERVIKGSTYIHRPFIAVAGTIQPEVLPETAKGNSFGNGFTHRMLFVIPDNVTKPYYSDNDLPNGIEEQYKTIINRLLDIPLNYDVYENVQPIELTLSIEARNAWKEWQKRNTDAVNEGTEYGGEYSKLDIHSLRLALILQMLHNACEAEASPTVNIEAMNGAIKLTEYFRRTAEIAHGYINNANPIDTLPQNKAALYTALPETFKTSEALALAQKFGIKSRTIENWLKKDKQLFIKKSQGIYSKAA